MDARGLAALVTGAGVKRGHGLFAYPLLSYLAAEALEIVLRLRPKADPLPPA